MVQTSSFQGLKPIILTYSKSNICLKLFGYIYIDLSSIILSFKISGWTLIITHKLLQLLSLSLSLTHSLILSLSLSLFLSLALSLFLSLYLSFSVSLCHSVSLSLSISFSLSLSLSTPLSLTLSVSLPFFLMLYYDRS